MKPHRMLCLAREAQQSANMPDLSILVALAEYYEVEMKELLDGERSQNMNKEMKETLGKVADYENLVKQKAFGIRKWWLILSAAILTGIAGFLLIFRPSESARIIMILFGLTLLTEGILNLITILTAVKIMIIRALSEGRKIKRNPAIPVRIAADRINHHFRIPKAFESIAICIFNRASART